MFQQGNNLLDRHCLSNNHKKLEEQIAGASIQYLCWSSKLLASGINSYLALSIPLLVTDKPQVFVFRHFNVGYCFQTQKRVCREQLFICGQMTETLCIIRVTLQDGVESGTSKFYSELFFGQQVRMLLLLKLKKRNAL